MVILPLQSNHVVDISLVSIHLRLDKDVEHFLDYGVPVDWEGVVALNEK